MRTPPQIADNEGTDTRVIGWTDDWAWYFQPRDNTPGNGSEAGVHLRHSPEIPRFSEQSTGNNAPSRNGTVPAGKVKL